MSEKDDLIQGLLTVIRWRCCVCNEPATRVPTLRDLTRRTQVFIGETNPTGGGLRVEILFQATKLSKANLKFERWWGRYRSEERLSFSLRHKGLEIGPLFCDEHGFDGIYAYMNRDFDLIDLEYARLIRQTLTSKEPEYSGPRPTRYEREWVI